MAELDEPFHQNDEAAKRFKGGKGGQKRKQPGTPTAAGAGPITSSSSSTSPSPTLFSTQHPRTTQAHASPLQAQPGSAKARGSNTGPVYQQPKSLQHHPLPSHPLQLDPAAFGNTASNNIKNSSSSSFQLHRSNSISSSSTGGDRHGSFSVENSNGAMAPRHTSNGSIDSQACTFLDYPADASKAVTVVDHSSSEDLDTLTAMLAETTLNNVAYFGPSAAMVASTFNDDDLWGPQLGAASTEGDILVPEEMQILPDPATREQLAALYYKRSAFISQAITMALDMGLHTRLDDTVNQFMRSYRSRVFWCCYLFDSTASAISGKPTLINDEEITVDMFEAGDLGPETETFSDQYIIHCLHGWQICRKIRKNSKLIVRRPPPPQAVLLQNLARLDNELVEWQENLPKVFDFLPVEGAIVSDVSTLAACAQLLCYALIILLHHPYLPNPKSPEAFQPPQPGTNLPDSQGYCTQAAKEITKIAGILLKEAPRSFEQNTPSRYALNFAIRIHLRNSKCTVDPVLAKESRRDLQKSMDYIERVENLQFFRINRAKKSDVADLLASCRAALAQQKSSLDLAKEAAALKHQQMLQEKKEKQRQLLEQQKHQQQQLFQQQQQQQEQQQQQQQQQTQQQSQQQELPQHPVLASQAGLSQQNQQQQQQQQQQSYKQQLQLQMYTQERDQQELARFNQLQRQGQLDIDQQRHQHFQQLAMAKHKQQIFMQQQQLQQTHGYRQQQPQQQYQQHQQQVSQPHPLAQSVQHQQHQHHNQHQQQFHPSIQPSQDPQQQYQQSNLQPVQPVSVHQLQNSTLFQGQPQAANFGQSMGMSNGELASTAPLAMLDFRDPTVFASLPQEHQQQLFMAFSSSLNSGGNNAYYPTSQSFSQGAAGMDGANVGIIQGQDNPMVDFSSMMFDEQQRQMFSSAASASIQNQGGTITFQTTSSTMEPSNGLIEDVFLSTGAGPTTSIQARSMRSRSNTGSQLGAGSIPSPSPSVQSQAQLHHQRTASQGLAQPNQQQQQQGSTLGNAPTGTQHQRSSSNNNTMGNPNNHGSPESMPSPGGSISEESILQSWSISTLHDNIYLNPNLARDDPRNDLGTFVYLPSEFEYGDAPALSPAASSVNGSGSVSGQGNGSAGSDGGLSPRILS
ncbi:lactose regulatory protein lac9 and GAL4-like protein [Mortierella alpina]|nr:lactose regulatory protein lac9 and GAL4-like protein [Mortierella alpina]